MLSEQHERRVRGESLVELINKPLDMSQQVDDDGGGDLVDDEKYQQAMQVSQASRQPAVMQPDSSNLPMVVCQQELVVCPKLENLHQSPPTSEPAETPTSPPRSDIEQRCTFIHSSHFLTITFVTTNISITTMMVRCAEQEKGTISPPPLTRLPTLTAR